MDPDLPSPLSAALMSHGEILKHEADAACQVLKTIPETGHAKGIADMLGSQLKEYRLTGCENKRKAAQRPRRYAATTESNKTPSPAPAAKQDLPQKKPLTTIPQSIHKPPQIIAPTSAFAAGIAIKQERGDQTIILDPAAASNAPTIKPPQPAASSIPAAPTTTKPQNQNAPPATIALSPNAQFIIAHIPEMREVYEQNALDTARRQAAADAQREIERKEAEQKEREFLARRAEVARLLEKHAALLAEYDAAEQSAASNPHPTSFPPPAAASSLPAPAAPTTTQQHTTTAAPVSVPGPVPAGFNGPSNSAFSSAAVTAFMARNIEQQLAEPHNQHPQRLSDDEICAKVQALQQGADALQRMIQEHKAQWRRPTK